MARKPPRKWKKMGDLPTDLWVPIEAGYGMFVDLGHKSDWTDGIVVEPLGIEHLVAMNPLTSSMIADEAIADAEKNILGMPLLPKGSFQFKAQFSFCFRSVDAMLEEMRREMLGIPYRLPRWDAEEKAAAN